MSRTQRKDFKSKGKRTHRDKSVKKKEDRKDFGYTSGTHSQWESFKRDLKKRANDSTDPLHKLYSERYEEIKNKHYPVKGVDYIKYGYGNGTKIKDKEKLIARLKILEAKRKSVKLTPVEEKRYCQINHKLTGYPEKVFTQDFSDKLDQAIKTTEEFLKKHLKS